MRRSAHHHHHPLLTKPHHHPHPGLSQYPHEAEICFPPLTALEVRGTRVDSSLTIIIVDARLAEIKDVQLSRMIKTFNTSDRDESGVIDRHEFRQLARELIPSCTDAFCDEVFSELDIKGANGAWPLPSPHPHTHVAHTRRSSMRSTRTQTARSPSPSTARTACRG